jgi:ribosome maturation factor RimP
MDIGNLEIWREFLGKKVKVLVQDEHDVKKKIGVLKNISETHLFLDIGERVDIILLTKIIRVEVGNNGY